MKKIVLIFFSSILLFNFSYGQEKGHQAMGHAAPLDGKETTKEPAEVQDANLGKISGKVIYEGGKVHKLLSVIKDENTCGTNDLIDESLLAGEAGGLKWAVVSIAGEVADGKSFDNLPGEPVLDQLECVYTPHVVFVGVNQPLVINNMDHTLHNVRSVSFMNDVVNKVQIYIPNTPPPSDEVVFNEEEIVEIVCDVHGWMKAFVHVVKHAYHSVTDEGGQFELLNVPPGKYTLKVWHEKLGEQEQQIVVKAGETTALSFSYKKKKN